MSGRLKQEIHVQHHLTGAAVVYVNQLREWTRCTNGVEKVMELFGTLVSKAFTQVFFFGTEGSSFFGFICYATLQTVICPILYS